MGVHLTTQLPEVKNEWRLTSPPLVCLHGVHGNNVTDSFVAWWNNDIIQLFRRISQYRTRIT